MVFRQTDMLISVHIDIYFVTHQLPRGDALPYPLLARHVDIHRWVEGVGEVHCGPIPYEVGCIRIATILDLTEWVARAMIIRLVGSASPHRVLGPQIDVLQQLQVGNFFYLARFLYRGMMHQLTQVQRGILWIFYYGSVLSSIMYERVVMLHPILAVPPGPSRDPCM